MKQILYLRQVFTATILLTTYCANAQWVSIPDTNFGKWLNTSGYINCLQGNSAIGWEMDTTCNEVVNAVAINCSSRNIFNMQGVEYFKSLATLNCNNNYLTSLPILPGGLNSLYCQTNFLDSLPTQLPSGLQILHAESNNLSKLSNLPNTLKSLKLNSNRLASLPTLPSSLEVLECAYNLLNSLPTLNESLTRLWCTSNMLTALPVLPSKLVELYCSANNLSSLPSLPDSLDFLYCNNNPQLLCLPKLGYVRSLAFYSTGISCLPNYPRGNFVSNPSINSTSICNIFNTNGCDVYYNISGKVYFDNNFNCDKNVNEMPLQVKVRQYRNGTLEQQVVSRVDGTYTFDTDQKNFEISIDTLSVPYRVICPNNDFHTISLSSTDSVKTNVDFGLRCKIGVDLGVHTAVNDSGILFPAQQAGIHVTAGDLSSFYGLNCAAGVSGAVSITYSGPVSFAGVMSGALVPVVSDKTFTYTIADFGAIDMQTAFGLRFLVDTFAQIGQLLCLDVVVTPIAGDNNVSNNTATYCFGIVNSYDPNMKEVSPVNSIAPDENWLTYTIHFQNMGNAPAIHIYVMDTLDNNLDESSIQILGSSHRMLTEIKGNIARFNFPNINLVDSATNEPESKGWLQYKIKKNTNLALGSQIKNTASIYFDFNAPVVTNTVTNTVEQPSAVSFPSSEGLGVGLYPNPANNDVFITYSSNTSADVTLFNINGAACLKQQLTASNQSISLSGLPAGVYFVSVEIQGSVVRKKVVKW